MKKNELINIKARMQLDTIKILLSRPSAQASKILNAKTIINGIINNPNDPKFEYASLKRPLFAPMLGLLK
ncbi:MAG: hypothetical protein ACLTYB_16435, partial [Clostridium paraputrificum]